MRPSFGSVLLAALCACAGATAAQASPIKLDREIAIADATFGRDLSSWDATDAILALGEDDVPAPPEWRPNLDPAHVHPVFELPVGHGSSARWRHGTKRPQVHSVPEPGTLLLLATGIGVLATRTLRTRQRQ